VRVTFENCVVVERNGQNSHQNSQMPQASKPMVSSQRGGNDSYAAALAEIEEGRLDKGAWARSFAESGGDESKAKALYIKTRAESISKADVWVDTQPQTLQHEPAPESGSDSDVPSGGYEPGQDGRNTVSCSKSGTSRNLIWLDSILIGVVGVVGYILYLETTVQQTVVAKPVQAPAPQVDWSQFTPVPAAKTAPVERSQIDEFLDEASKPTTWDSYVQKVLGLEAAVNRGELPQVDGVVSFGQQRYSTQWPSADAAALESGQTWWRDGSGNDFHIHVKNSTPNSLTVLGLEYSESSCESKGERSRFFVTLPNRLAAGTQSVINFKPELTESKEKNNCLVIFSAW